MVDYKKQKVRGNLLSPLPVALVGALVNGKPNFLVIGYISPFNFGKHIFFSLFIASLLKNRNSSSSVTTLPCFSRCLRMVRAVMLAPIIAYMITGIRGKPVQAHYAFKGLGVR